MFWNESNQALPIKESQLVIDASIQFNCKQLPGDHIFSLYQSLVTSYPWLKSDPLISIQQLFLPSSGNGWQRQEHSPDSIIHLSRRTRLTIRIPISLREKIKELVGCKINVSGYIVTLGQIKFSAIETSEILVARFTYYNETDHDEELFLQKAYQEITSRNIKVSKMLCGKTVKISMGDKLIHSRSLMIAELEPKDSLLLQEQGIGEYSALGCGIFIPQKGIKPVNPDEQ